MAPPTWAYQADNFDPPPDEELICSICRSVFCDPVQSPCNHVFCRSCINKWMESNRNCPICRKRTTKYTVQEVVPLIKNMIMKLTLYCHNKEEGCEEKFPLESCESHMKVCPYETACCTNRPCKEMLMRKDLVDHELNHCLHRYIRCQNCGLKISTIEPTEHNCVTDLKKKLKEKNETIKNKNLKIEKLQEEVKSLKEAQPDSSDISSLESLSAGDILINLPSPNNSFESTSFASESDGDDDDEDSFQIAGFLSNPFSAVDEEFLNDFSNEEDSIEYPRAASPAAHGNSSAVNPLDSADDEELPIRRPAKRRRPVRTLDSSEEENNAGIEPPPVSSPKRISWRQMLDEAGQSSQGATGIQDIAIEGRAENNYLPSSSTASSSLNATQVLHSNIPFKLQPRIRKSGSEQTTAASVPPTRRDSRGIFERTRALLEQYSLESDPEWLPPIEMDVEDLESDSDSSFHPATYVEHFSPSTDSSSSEDDSSSDSSYVDAQSRTNMLRGLYSTSSSDDPDWIPP